MLRGFHKHIVILKFGGSAVASAQRFERIAHLISRRSDEGVRVVVVVSAMGNMTDSLLSLARKIHPHPPKREQDMLISVGERISMSLLAMALDLKGKTAISLTGSQAGIITTAHHLEARIVDVRPHRVVRGLEEGNIIIVAGFQGVSREGEITTLGRGGSDTTAVALAVALGAEKVEFYKDVPGIFSEDPMENSQATLHSALNYDEALSIIQRGKNQILHNRCILLAKKNRLPLEVISFTQLEKSPGTVIQGYAVDSLPNSTLLYEDE